MSEASSLAGRKRERSARSQPAKGDSHPQAPEVLDLLAAAREACSQLTGKAYPVALNEIALALQRIFSARLVVVRDASPGEPFGLAPAGIDPTDWLDTLDRLHGSAPDSTVRSFSVSAGDAWPRASGIEQFVVIPLEQPHGCGTIWLGFSGPSTMSADNLRGFSLLGDALALALWRLSEQSLHDDGEPSGKPSTSELISIAAHELRTPLTPITMLLQALERKARWGNADVESISRTRRQVNRLAQMISDLLDITRLREGRLVINRSPIEFPMVVSHAVDAFREADPRKRLVLTIPDAPLAIVADDQRLQQAVIGMLDHVARVKPSDGAIHVDVEHRNGTAVIRIAPEPSPIPVDDIALPPGILPKKAQPLALAAILAQELVVELGGKLQMEGLAGEDPRVTMTFPLATEGS